MLAAGPAMLLAGAANARVVIDVSAAPPGPLPAELISARTGRGVFETVGCDGALKGLSPTAPCAKASPVQPAAPASAVATRPAASANFGTAARRPLIAWDRGPDGLPDTLRVFCTLRFTGNRLSIAAGPETPLKTTPLK